MKIFLTAIIIILLFQTLSCIAGEEAYYVKLHQNPDDHFSCILLQEETLRKYKGFNNEDEHALNIRVKAAVQAPADSMIQIKDNSKIVEIFARKQSIAHAHIDTLCKSRKNLPDLTFQQAGEPEIQKIIDGGDQSNRIDVVFMGDGYQADEREEFFEDIRRLTKDMFEGVTFRSYLPVFNIWAIYVESVDSGIGYDGPKDTPFGLYREQGQLRAIYPGNSNYARQICRLTNTSGCDYPSLIGNDDFYGGLGGEFVISTRSNRTGTVVLRHEMGHNFVDVGEEYDNGYVYDGVNAAGSLSTLGWRSWLTDGPNPKEERAMYRLLEYPWADLSKGDVSFTFNSDGAYSRWYLLVSVSAAGENDSLEFILDGKVLPWNTKGYDDRAFYDWYGEEGFSQGTHNFSVRSKTPPTNDQIPRMICSVNLHEFGSESEFHMDNNYISAYPTWDFYGGKSFRPSNAGCIMRNMSHSEFCPICREGMWYQFLQRISLIDSVDVDSVSNPNGTKTVTLKTLSLGKFRAPGNEVVGERLEVSWALGGVEQVQFKDQFQINASNGSWTVTVQLITPEVRTDPQGLLNEMQSFMV